MDFVLEKSAVDVVGVDFGDDIDAGVAGGHMVGAPAQPATPTEVLAFTDLDVMKKIDVDGIAGFPELRPDADGAVYISLQVQIGTAAEIMAPTRQEIATCNGVVADEIGAEYVGRVAAVGAAFERHGVVAGV